MKVAREIIVDVPVARRDAALAAVYALGVMGVQERRVKRRVQIVAWLPPTEDTLRALEAIQLPGARVSWRDVPVTWEDATVARAGRFTLAPLDHPVGAEVVRLEPGLAFGDGLHPTTALCVEALERIACGGRVLDVGTGTGVLAIVAERLGAAEVLACDTDPLAVWSARRAVEANGARVTVTETLPDGTFDLVIANLYLQPLLGLIGALVARTGGTLVVSGFVAEVRERVEAALVGEGMSVTCVTERDGWVCLEVGHRTPLPPGRRPQAAAAPSPSPRSAGRGDGGG